MKAWVVTGRPGTRRRVECAEVAVPEAGPGELLIRVRACGVCRTDLHLADLELPARVPRRVPGHEVVGDVVQTGAGVQDWEVGDRVGVAWLRSTCGACLWCRSGQENLCRESQYTGWDADGGFAEYTVAPAAFAYRLPEDTADLAAAPLLCSGIIGLRALNRAQVPDGGSVGLYGFGASAHITAQIALARGLHVYAISRDAAARALALELGAAWAGGVDEQPPVPLAGAVLFAPVGHLVSVALRALDQGATLAVACIHLTDIPVLSYQEHLFRERTLTSVTANTKQDGVELLALADAIGIRPRTRIYDFDHVDVALEDLATGQVAGAAVVQVS